MSFHHMAYVLCLMPSCLWLKLCPMLAVTDALLCISLAKYNVLLCVDACLWLLLSPWLMLCCVWWSFDLQYLPFCVNLIDLNLVTSVKLRSFCAQLLEKWIRSWRNIKFWQLNYVCSTAVVFFPESFFSSSFFYSLSLSLLTYNSIIYFFPLNPFLYRCSLGTSFAAIYYLTSVTKPLPAKYLIFCYSYWTKYETK